MNEKICTLTKQEIEELKARFDQYAKSGDPTTLKEFKSELGIKYGFDPDKISITEDGTVRNVF